VRFLFEAESREVTTEVAYEALAAGVGEEELAQFLQGALSD
jgi:hypothetical protein